jgi:NitT/TauT family transport system permease protein
MGETTSGIPRELHEEIPSFAQAPEPVGRASIDFTALTSIRTGRGLLEVGTILAVGAAIFFGTEGVLRWINEPEYVIPRPFNIVSSYGHDFWPNYGHHLWVTMQEFLIGVAIGSAIGLALAALITQKPFAEKVIAPYIILLATTPVLALVPGLRLTIVRGFSIWPIVVAVAIASGPMVMINSATGFRRTELSKIALARSYGASTFQVFRLVRFPAALPMIIVGFMVGSIFGFLTAIAGEMVSASTAGGLGHQLIWFSANILMDQFGATILLISALGISIWVVFYFVGRRWASWQA